MARQSRLVVPGQAHYVRQRVVHGQRLAIDDDDRSSLYRTLNEVSRALDVTVLAYAFAADELHLLMIPLKDTALSRMMQTLSRRYVAGFNRRHGRHGALWGARFSAAVIQKGECLLATMLLIDGLLPDDSKWSSCAHRIGRQLDPVLSDPPEVWALGNTPFAREKGYQARLFAGISAEQAQRIGHAALGSWAVGTPAFVDQMTTAAGRPAAPRARGRPRHKTTERVDIEGNDSSTVSLHK